MVVVKLVTAQPDRDRRDVPALILHVVVSVAKRVTNSIDDPRSPERNPDHLYTPHQRAHDPAEKPQVNAQHEDDAEPIARRQHMTLNPVVWCPLSILLQDPGLANCVPVI